MVHDFVVSSVANSIDGGNAEIADFASMISEKLKFELVLLVLTAINPLNTDGVRMYV